jgi:hypothetical protein
MPPWGLTPAFGRDPVAAAREAAKQRMQAGALTGAEARNKNPI